MTLKSVAVRIFCSIVAGFAVLFAYMVINENRNDIAQRMVFPYIPLTSEEVYRLARVPCVRPKGADAGCERPRVQLAQLTGDVLLDSHLRQLADSQDRIIDLTLAGPQAAHRREWEEREIAPVAKKIGLWADIIGGTFGLVIFLYAMTVIWTWLASQGFARIGQTAQLVADSGSKLLDLKGKAESRKLQELERDFLALKTLFDNGIISEEDYTERKARFSAAYERNKNT